MPTIYYFVSRLPILLLSLFFSTQVHFTSRAQSLAPPLASAAAKESASFASYSAAHDSLMRDVALIHARTEASQSHFKASKGSFGRLHRRVKTYFGTDQKIKEQVIKHRFGIELDKVTYHDLLGRRVLTERYEGQQLTRLELRKYPDQIAAPATSKWLFVRGDYLMYSFPKASTPGQAARKISCFFKARPTVE